MRGAVFVQPDLPGQQQCRLDVRGGRGVHADRCGLDLGVGQFNLPFFFAHHKHEGFGGCLRNDLDLERVGFRHDLAADQAVFLLGESQLLLFVSRAGHRCCDRCRIQGQSFVFVEQPDAQPRLAAVL